MINIYSDRIDIVLRGGFKGSLDVCKVIAV